ncbi:MAG TPA: translation initiation factor IF-3 [Rhodospirillaceae bacterium]|nr:translation initiation factor IF-3 [Alphaproteobacteria bacterium]OUT40803.1 MAG: translation initiation factor IF-3 [Micavibrio sp. TMED2]HCI47460.1 translation initiation factor IF-3 [Rhodospirillaceae bacterium]MAS47724.1 translation initiation factor IF-3 [Alphaproteobacteria bacterium]MAX96404.1 translation initiation factor IF-3 [Alphaproteobacteria bacterium]
MRRPRSNEAPARHDGPRVNDMIDNAKVRLVDADGEMVGVVDIEEAMRRADEAGMDLVEIAAQADPPVCKVLDYGKFRYEQQKRQNEARKKQKITDVKEIKVRPNIDDHDYEVKMRNARRFIDSGDKVKVTLRFRGREMAHQDLGIQVLERIRDDLEEIAKVEQMPKMEGRQAIMVLQPR